MRKREKMRGEKDRYEASEESSVKHETSPVRAYLTLSNVTQAAVHKERWREKKSIYGLKITDTVWM